MTKKPALLVMAAGMGRRYGGLKQIEPVTRQGELLLDFSAYDARRAGFERIVFVITRAIEKEFRQAVGDRIAGHMDVGYAFQELNDLPEGGSMPEGRVKPWGTGHAVLTARNLIDGPFAVINADDYYGQEGYRLLYGFLDTLSRPDQYAMVGFLLNNTLTEHGFVSRGVCSVDESGHLLSVTERLHVERRGGGIKYTEDGCITWHGIERNAIASMNMWGFPADFMSVLEDRFAVFLRKLQDPLRAEYFLPGVVGSLLSRRKVTVDVLHTSDRWYGVTYREDKPVVEGALNALKANGVYPERLWEVRGS